MKIAVIGADPAGLSAAYVLPRQQAEVDVYESADSVGGLALWAWQDNDLISLARRELIEATLVRDEAQILNAFVYRVPRCYPVYRRGYKALRA